MVTNILLGLLVVVLYWVGQCIRQFNNNFCTFVQEYVKK